MGAENTVWQKIMDKAYENYGAGMSYRQFIESLPEIERNAVLLGNLNCQVENGGFSQFISNGYILASSDLVAFLEELSEECPIAGELASKLLKLMRFVDMNSKDRGFRDYFKSERAGESACDLAEEYDDWYYKTAQPILLPFVESYLAKITAGVVV